MPETVIEPSVSDPVSESSLSKNDGEPALGQSATNILTALAREKKTITWTTGAAVLVGLAFVLLMPVRFTATARIMTPSQTQSAAALLMSQLTASTTSSLMSTAGASLGLHSPNDAFIGLLNSRPIADAIIQQFELMKLYSVRDMSGARKKLAENTRILSDKSGLIAISVTDLDKKRAADMANTYITQLRALTKGLAVTEAAQRRLFYEDQMKSAKEDLVAAEFAFLQVQDKKGMFQPAAQARALIDTLAGIRAQIAAKRVELGALRSYSTEQNAEVRLAENQLSSLQDEAQQLEQRSHSSGFSDLGVKDVPGASLEYLRSEHELQHRQMIYDLLFRQYEAAKLDEAKDAAVIQTVETAIPPDRKSSPSRILTVLWFAMLGFLGGCMYVVGSERVRRSPKLIQSLREFRAELSVWR